MIVRAALLSLIAGILALTLGACSGGSGGPRGKSPPVRPSAQPGLVVAAEIGLARAVREQRDFKAYISYAAPDAITFLPRPARAQDALRGAIRDEDVATWQPARIWSSCDGSLAISTGPWSKASGGQGSFVTIWRREAGGPYKWVLVQNIALPQLPDTPEMVQAEVADCGSGQKLSIEEGNVLAVPGHGAGIARDGTLAYEWNVDPDLSRHLTITMIDGGAAQEVFSLTSPAPTG